MTEGIRWLTLCGIDSLTTQYVQDIEATTECGEGELW